jgi:hypothetical protein
MSFRNPLLPYTAVSGFIFTNPDEGEKVVQIDLIASKQIKSFTFFVQIPGIRVDYQMVEFVGWLCQEVVKAVPYRHVVLSIPKILEQIFRHEVLKMLLTKGKYQSKDGSQTKVLDALEWLALLKKITWGFMG